MNILLVEKTVSYDWSRLFDEYNKDGKNLLDKQEVKQIMIDCKLPEVTDREAQFAFNVISRFTYKIDKKQFLSWVDVIF